MIEPLAEMACGSRAPITTLAWDCALSRPFLQLVFSREIVEGIRRAGAARKVVFSAPLVVVPRVAPVFSKHTKTSAKSGRNCSSKIGGLQPLCGSREMVRADGENAMRLLMSEAGEIACERHAPHAGSDTRVLGRWRAMRTSERIDFAAEVGRLPSCETCDAVARRHSEGAHETKRSDECALCAGGAS